jgi:class 3 adenylate cyclase
MDKFCQSETLSQIEDSVEAESLGELRLKGIAQPIQAFKITALTS